VKVIEYRLIDCIICRKIKTNLLNLGTVIGEMNDSPHVYEEEKWIKILIIISRENE